MIDTTTACRPRFSLGQIVATPGAFAALDRSATRAESLIRRHVSGDWGVVGLEDATANVSALADDTRILSAYELNDRTRVWIITESDRSATTILLPEEY